MKEKKKLKGGAVVLQTQAARTRAITRYTKQGYNYFVLYQSKGKPAVQYTYTNSPWVLRQAKDGIFVSGNNQTKNKGK
jgi:hypothetical protein